MCQVPYYQKSAYKVAECTASLTDDSTNTTITCKRREAFASGMTGQSREQTDTCVEGLTQVIQEYFFQIATAKDNTIKPTLAQYHPSNPSTLLVWT